MTWFVTGFEKDGDALTHEVDLDEALRSIVSEFQPEDPPAVGPVSLNHATARRLGEILGLDLDAERASYVLEYADPVAYYDVDG